MSGFVLYTYLIYPAVIIFFAKYKTQIIDKKDFKIWPQISIVIAAKNEEKNIAERINNLLSQNYPSDRYEIIIVSDGSDDKTNEIVQKLSSTSTHPAIYLIENMPSRGKPHALNTGIKKANGEIIVFTDARQQFDKNSLNELVANFSDPKIGAVSGELFFKDSIDSNVKLQMGAYWNYEKLIRRSESAFSSVAGATGAIYAIRKSLYKPIPDETLIDDVLIPMNIVLQGYRVVFDNTAAAYDVVSQNSDQEWRRKVRTQAGNWQLLNLNPTLFMPWKNPIFLQFMSHKIFRIIVPFLLPIILLNSFLLGGLFYNSLTFLQLLVYGTALLGMLSKELRNNKIIGFSYFFVIMNASAISGFRYWASGNCHSLWSRPTHIKNENAQ